jgi:outer membrane protein OmpA-like peptidoglycan-associated protein
MQRLNSLSALLLLATALSVSVAAAQIPRGIKRKVRERVERAQDRAADRALDAVEGAVKCVVTDQACIDNAERSGKPVVVTDAQGQPLPAERQPAGSQPPGTGVWANYDFKPGDRIIFADDFSMDEVGDFPRRLEFRGGQVEIVVWNDRRWLRAAEGRFLVPLRETLPERFTLEFDLAGNGNAMLLQFDGGSGTKRLFVGQEYGRLISGEVDAQGRYGVNTGDDDNRPPMNAKPAHVAISVDGQHVKMYVNETRVFNAPNGDLGRSNKISVDMNGSSAELPRLIANLRIAAGGKKLYDALAAAGRVATQGIYFATGSDVLRPESTPVLKEIAAMLQEHGDLKLLIEGHTDNVGDDAANRALSEKRAAAVMRYLVERAGIDASRLEAKGFGESKPVASNDTPEGRQQNRRVELVKM